MDKFITVQKVDELIIKSIKWTSPKKWTRPKNERIHKVGGFITKSMK